MTRSAFSRGRWLFTGSHRRSLDRGKRFTRSLGRVLES
jgi:hypothetical protein